MKKGKKAVLNIISKSSVAAGVAGSLLFGMANPVAAQDDWMPEWLATLIDNLDLDGEGPVGTIKGLVQWGIMVLFAVVFIVAVIYSALAGIKFITSQGDASKLEESKGAVKAILLGFAAMIIAIVGIFIIFWIFNVSPNTTFNNKPPTF